MKKKFQLKMNIFSTFEKVQHVLKKTLKIRLILARIRIERNHFLLAISED